MRILVLNVGSSSVKYDVYDNEKFLFKGIVQRIKDKKGYVNAFRKIADVLEQKDIKVKAVGHRVVHGGLMTKSSIIDGKALNVIKKYSKFAPLHNPPEIIGIEICKKLFNVRQVAVFDTAFHQTINEKAFVYALPYNLYEKVGIRRYGFHGTSHKYVMEEVQKILGKKNLKIITCHLGNGASVTAIENGKSVDTSMGFTPLEGLMMGTRCGDIDPAIVTYLIKDKGMNVKNVHELLEKKSGLLGVSGISSDVRDLVKAKSKRAKLALEIFCYKIAKYIGAYAAALDGVDTIVFTAGIGENSGFVRENVLRYFDYLGVKLDRLRNKMNELVISKKNSKIKVLVIPTNEELMIVREVIKLIR